MSEHKVKVRAIPVSAYELSPGDLFSAVGPEYWDNAMDKVSIAEKAFIRTNTPTEFAPDGEAQVYRLEIIYEPAKPAG